MSFAVLVIVVLLLACANGANDNFKAVASVFGTRTLGFREALRLGTVAQLAGSAASLVLAADPVEGKAPETDIIPREGVEGVLSSEIGTPMPVPAGRTSSTFFEGAAERDSR